MSRHLRLALVLFFLLVPATPSGADTAITASVQDLNRFYQLRKTAPARALFFLRRSVRRDASNARAWEELGFAELAAKRYRAALSAFEGAVRAGIDTAAIHAQIGYILIELKRKPEAIAAFRRSLARDPKQEVIEMQIAFLLDETNRKGEAYRTFRRVARKTRDDARFRTACKATNVLGFAATKVLPEPWFGEFYMAPEWRPNLKTGIFPFEMRLGATVLREPRVELYGSLRINYDSRSTVTPLGPQIFFDNAIIPAFGVRAYPLPKIPLSFFAEIGAGYDLIDRGRSRWRTDFRVGAAYFKEWNMTSACPRGVTFPFRFVADLYADANFFTRFDDNFIATVRARPGIRVMETAFSNIDLYVLVFGSVDSDRLDFNNVIELGPGVAFTPRTDLNLRLRVEGVYRMFINGERDWDPRIRLEVFFRF